MRFVIDEDMTVAVAAVLPPRGHDVLHVREHLAPGTPDLDVAGLVDAEPDVATPAIERESAAMEECRTRLTADAVTGQVDVRRPHLHRPSLAAARAARRSPTPSEARAWDLLRGRRCLGLKFRREQVIEGFRVDLYCASLRLSIEVDGCVHDAPERRAYDALRTQILNNDPSGG